MKLTDLKLNPNNPQKYTKKQLDTLIKSIKDFSKMMKLRPIVYDPKTMEVLGGNKRLLCLKKLKYKEIPDDWVLSADDLTEDEKKRFIIQDNVQIGDWEIETLLENWDIGDLLEWGVNIESDSLKEEDEKDIEIYNLYQITIDFKDEEDLKNGFEDLTKIGYKCKIITI